MADGGRQQRKRAAPSRVEQQQQQQQQQQQEFDSKNFQHCDFCFRLCSSLEELCRHQRACHCDEREALRCRACGAMFASRERLVAHAQSQHSEVNLDAPTALMQRAAAAAAAAAAERQRRMRMAAAVILQQRQQHLQQHLEQKRQEQLQEQQRLHEQEQRQQHMFARLPAEETTEVRAAPAARVGGNFQENHSPPPRTEQHLGDDCSPLFPVSQAGSATVLPLREQDAARRDDSSREHRQISFGPTAQGERRTSTISATTHGNTNQVVPANELSPAVADNAAATASRLAATASSAVAAVAAATTTSASTVPGTIAGSNASASTSGFGDDCASSVASDADAVKSQAFLQVRKLLKQIEGDEIYKVVESLSSKERRTLIAILRAESAAKKQQKQENAGDGASEKKQHRKSHHHHDHGKGDKRTLKSLLGPPQMLGPDAQKMLTGDKFDAFSDISTGSKKEFLRRYKRQILNDESASSLSSHSSRSGTTFLFPTAANSITATERQLLLDDFGAAASACGGAVAAAHELEEQAAAADAAAAAGEGGGVGGESEELPQLTRPIMENSFDNVLSGIHKVISKQVSVTDSHQQEDCDEEQDQHEQVQGEQHQFQETGRGLRKVMVFDDDGEDHQGTE